MINYVYTNCQLILDKMYLIINKSTKQDKLNKCPICKQIFKKNYIHNNINIDESSIHLLSKHKMIETNLYKQICELKVKNYPISWFKIDTNGINIIDGLYNIGSKDIYIKTNNFYGKTVFSEHAGFIYFKDEKLDKITVLTNYRIDKEDPVIFLPKNSKEAFNVNYIFHTHPTTPFIGSRMTDKIIYEFPSISDISHFVEHHNNGLLDGSLIVTPEGIYIIRKHNFDRNKIKIDYSLFISKLSKVYRKCYQDSTNDYSNIKTKIVDKHILIPKEIFYSKISNNFKYIDAINDCLSTYDIYVDYYPRTKLKPNEWIFKDIYIPFL
jgi:hypothetical protein